MRRAYITVCAGVGLAMAWQSMRASGSRASVDFQLRGQIRYQAELAGVTMSNVWNRADSARRLATFGGTLDSTQALFRLFRSVQACTNQIDTIAQSVTTREGNPFPPQFAVGYEPVMTNTPRH